MKLLAGLMLAIQAEQDECGPANHKVNRVILLFLKSFSSESGVVIRALHELASDAIK